MCMFTGPVERVDATRIFARKTAADRQLLIYEMKLAAAAGVAMVLPLPIVAGAGEPALRFIALDHAKSFFEDLEILFDPPPAQAFRTLGVSVPLKVHQVGAFEASFVPQLADFARLDPRFRMPPGTLERIPVYADWGFAVFQLPRIHASSAIHPMGFEFQTRWPGWLFFPTLHCHDGEIHDRAKFTHQLYAQGIAPGPSPTGHPDDAWRPPWNGKTYQQLGAQTANLLDLQQSIAHSRVFGTRANDDLWAPLQVH